MNPNAAGCDGGFWLSPLDKGFKSNLALVLWGHSISASVVVYGQSDQLWPGSGAKYCRVYAVGVIPGAQ